MINEDAQKRELEALFSHEKIKIDGKDVVVKKYSFLSAMKLTAKLSNLAHSVLEDAQKASLALAHISYESENESEVFSMKLMGIMELLDLVGDSGIDFVKLAIEEATGLTDEEFEEIDAESGLCLLYEIYKVNKSFFTKFMTKLEAQTPKKKKTKEKKE